DDRALGLRRARPPLMLADRAHVALDIAALERRQHVTAVVVERLVDREPLLLEVAELVGEVDRRETGPERIGAVDRGGPRGRPRHREGGAGQGRAHRKAVLQVHCPSPSLDRDAALRAPAGWCKVARPSYRWCLARPFACRRATASASRHMISNIIVAPTRAV